MAMYAIVTLPLVHHLAKSTSVRQVWFADNVTAGGSLHLKDWWDELEETGTDIGYNANATKSWPIVKKKHYKQAVNVFSNSGAKVMKDGQSHLGAALGIQTFVEVFVTEKVDEWTKDVEQLATIASQPHAAYSALTHGLIGNLAYISRTVPILSDLFLPVKNALWHRFLPALTGKTGFTDLERELFALPTRLAGLGILSHSKTASHQFNCSQRVTASLTALILQQDRSYPTSAGME